MNLSDLLLAYLMTLGIGVLMLFMPALSRGTTFFAVTVPEGFASSETGRTIKRRYAALTAIPTLLALAAIAPVYWLFSGEVAAVLAYGIVPMLPVIGAMVAFVHCRGIAMRFSQDASGTREVSLRRDSLADIVPRPYWLHVVPYLLLAAAAGWLALNWSAIPNPAFVTSDLPDGRTAARSVFTVFGLPLAMVGTLVLCHAIMPLGLLIRRLPGHRRRVRSINTFLLVLIGNTPMQRIVQSMLTAAFMLVSATMATGAGAGERVVGSVGLAREYRQAHEAEILAGFAEFLRLPNVAEDLENMQRNAAWMREQFAARGIELDLLEFDGVPPLVTGRIDVPGAERRLGIYVHYDGQPVDESRWTNNPWTPVLYTSAIHAGGSPRPFPAPGERVDPEARLYARSAGDDKAPIVALLAALNPQLSG